MKINLVCECGKVLEELNHSESLALAEKIMNNVFSDEIMPIKVSFCKDCANKYMYSNGTMKFENRESVLG